MHFRPLEQRLLFQACQRPSVKNNQPRPAEVRRTRFQEVSVTPFVNLSHLALVMSSNQIATSAEDGTIRVWQYTSSESRVIGLELIGECLGHSSSINVSLKDFKAHNVLIQGH